MKKQQDSKHEETVINPELLEAIHKAFPDDTFKMPLQLEESYFAKVCGEIRSQLRKIENIEIYFERDSEGKMCHSHRDGEANEAQGGHGECCCGSDECSEDEECHAGEESAASYHTFFLGLKGEEFQYECEISPEENEMNTGDEEDEEETILGTGIVGCSVGISLTAPFAMIKLDSMEFYEDDTHTLPDIAPDFIDYEDGDSEAVNMEGYYKDKMEPNAFKALIDLRSKIASIIESASIINIPESEWEKPLPWLKLEEEFVAPDKPLTVREALFSRFDLLDEEDMEDEDEE